MSDLYQKIVAHVQDMEVDVNKFYEKGQAAAGTRVRKALSELKALSQDMRNEIQDVKNERKNA